MHFYNNELKQLSQQLRSNMTDAEKLLWSKARRKQLKGYQFYRQSIIGNYIADFYCSKQHLSSQNWREFMKFCNPPSSPFRKGGLPESPPLIKGGKGGLFIKGRFRTEDHGLPTEKPEEPPNNADYVQKSILIFIFEKSIVRHSSRN